MMGRPVKCGGCEWVGPLEVFGSHIELLHPEALRPGAVFCYEPANGRWARQERGGRLLRIAAWIGWFFSALSDAAAQVVFG
jgi:hypothetical protein